MATEKQRFNITVDDSLYTKIEDCRFGKRIKSQSKAVNELMKIGFNALTGKHVNLGLIYLLLQAWNNREI